MTSGGIAIQFGIHKAVIQAKMLSGRYVTDQLSRHWTTNVAGICSLPGCSGKDLGSLEHLLLSCPSLNDTRSRIVELWLSVADTQTVFRDIILSVMYDQDVETVIQFLLDCSCFPAVVSLIQRFGSQYVFPLFHLTRSWCYSVHRSRMTKLGLLKYR